MPILPAEPDIYPPDLLTREPDEASTRTWWAIYTLARREKELMRRLRALELPHYGPMVKKKTRSASGRTRQSFIPLFASYVFLYGDARDRQQALTTNCVSQCFPVANGAQLARDLAQIQLLISSDAPLTPEARIEPGQRVRVRSGPMQGLEGNVIKRRGKEMLLVGVEFLQQGASILLEDFQVEVL